MKKIKTIIYLFVLSVIIISCTKESHIECTGLYELVEDNRANANLKCQGLASDYPKLSVISDKLLSMDCEAFEVGTIEEYSAFCSLIITKRTTIYKK